MAKLAKSDPNGEELLKTLVDLTQLPEGIVRDELACILDQTPGSDAPLTLEGLRAAMLAYLEAMEMASAERGPQCGTVLRA